MSTDSDFTRTFPPWNNGAKASGVPVCWLIIAGHLEGKSHRQDIAQSDPMLRFRYCTGDGQNKVNTRQYRKKIVCVSCTERTLVMSICRYSFVSLCCVVPVSMHYRLFGNRWYESTAKSETCQIFKKDRLLVLIWLDLL